MSDFKRNLILIAGLPASGKSSFAAWASRQLSLPVIAKDDIKEHLFDTVGFRSYEEKVRLARGNLKRQLPSKQVFPTAVRSFSSAR